MKKSLTLIELLIAIALLSVIVLGAVSFHVASDSYLRSSEKKTKILNELTFILEHIAKYVSLAQGDITNVSPPRPLETSKGICVYTGDILGEGGCFTDSPGTNLWIRIEDVPNPLEDDPHVLYGRDYDSHQLLFCDDASLPMIDICGGRPLSSRIINFSVSQAGLEANQVSVSLTLRYDPTKPSHPTKNPEVTVSPTRIIFASTSHSIN